MRNDPLSILIAVAAFGLVLSIWLVAVLLWSLRKKKRIDQVTDRLKLVQSAGAKYNAAADESEGRILRLWRDGQEATTVVPGVDPNQGFVAGLERYRVDAGLESSLRGLIFGGFGLLIFAGTVAYLL